MGLLYAGGPGSIPGQGTRSYMTQLGSLLMFQELPIVHITPPHLPSRGWIWASPFTAGLASFCFYYISFRLIQSMQQVNGVLFLKAESIKHVILFGVLSWLRAKHIIANSVGRWYFGPISCILWGEVTHRGQTNWISCFSPPSPTAQEFRSLWSKQ